jgi:cytoskeletal protein RodZ
MYYSIRQGAQPTWRNHINTIAKPLLGKRVLPAFVGILTVFWVSLLLFGLNLAGSTSGESPTKKTKDSSAQNTRATLTAASSPNTSVTSNSNTSTNTASIPVQSAARPTNLSVSTPTSSTKTTATTTTNTTETVGGKGAGAQTATEATVTPPTSTAPAPTTTDSSGVGVGVSVGNPLTGDGTLLDVGVGADSGGLDVNLDIL